MKNKTISIILKLLILFAISYIIIFSGRFLIYFIKFNHYNIPLSMLTFRDLLYFGDVLKALTATGILFALSYDYLLKKKEWNAANKKKVFKATAIVAVCVIIYVVGVTLITFRTRRDYQVINDRYVLLHNLANDKEGNERAIVTDAYVNNNTWDITINLKNHHVMTLVDISVYESDFSSAKFTEWDE